ncbi:efflux RND transporter periplasmic adaptor subunit [Roseovarius spongiae]|uniref:Efflux RND transporter periplasmic adaptor subunit n=1 Tax=Roseovarius spongiae TaxID=2320272 RepID=A0A3A8BBB4_9RHOB|nr:efflux RND transporter periplasmic adaptor subunit [Roseovarius spongiae]RKF16664.1 efflux RND transporter periplasmic adaptor subunit [Roseovarius spongiae]
MRLFPILAALVVCAVIYGVVFQREAVMEMLGGTAPGEAAGAEAAETASAPDATAAESAAAAGPVRVVAIHSVAQTIDSAIVLRGQTAADRQVEIRAETSGQVISEPLRKGSAVAEGQLLCRLDPASREATLDEARARRDEARARVPEAEARLAEAQARVAEAEINNTAATKLSEGGYASESRVAETRAALSSAQAAVQSAKSGLEAARTGIRAAEAAVAAAEDEIARLEMRAPFDGLLESDTAELGSLLQPGALCATVIQLDPIKLVGYVPETEVAKVAPGAEAHAALVSGQEVTGEVSFISRDADPETRTFRIEIMAPNPDLALRAGQSAEIAIASDGTDAHLLPQSALTLNDDGALGVRVVSDDSSADFTPVTLIRDTVRGVWVAGLPAQADVIVIGQEYVTSGVPVKPSYRDMTQ